MNIGEILLWIVYAIAAACGIMAVAAFFSVICEDDEEDKW